MQIKADATGLAIKKLSSFTKAVTIINLRKHSAIWDMLDELGIDADY